MRILIVHNFYRSTVPSGENSMVLAEIDLLRRKGHAVEVFSRSNDFIRKGSLWRGIIGLLSILGSPGAAFSLHRKLVSFKPDVVHVHNTFPLISPLAMLVVKGFPCVMTIHNYRMVCAGEILLRDGRPCTLCVEKGNVCDAIRNRCYRGSLVATLLMAANIAYCRHWRIWWQNVSRILVLTSFQKGILVKAGFPEDKLIVSPNFSVCRNELRERVDRRDEVVFAGRISKEKGLDVLVDAWHQLGKAAPLLRIYGDGDRRLEYERSVKSDRIVFMGKVSHTQVLEAIAQAKLLVVPSVCYDNMPTCILESYMLGVPVLASNLGPLPTIVKENSGGFLFESANAESLANKVKEIWDEKVLNEARMAALRTYETFFSEECYYERLMKIFREAIEQGDR